MFIVLDTSQSNLVLVQGRLGVFPGAAFFFAWNDSSGGKRQFLRVSRLSLPGRVQGQRIGTGPNKSWCPIGAPKKQTL